MPVALCSMLLMLFNGIPEMSLTVERFPVFFKQRDNLFYNALSFVLPGTIMRIPYSLVEAVVWTALTYFEVGLAPQADRWAAFPFYRLSCVWFELTLYHDIYKTCRWYK